MARSQAGFRVLCAFGTVFAPAVASAQVGRFQQQEVDRSNMTCSRFAQLCLQRQSQMICDGLRQRCMQTGTWEGATEISRNVQKR